jgi:hypothetical protein
MGLITFSWTHVKLVVTPHKSSVHGSSSSHEGGHFNLQSMGHVSSDSPRSQKEFPQQFKAVAFEQTPLLQ